MNKFLKNKKVLADCKIYTMLSSAAKKKHLSFHIPGHKIGKWDITELSFSDNLSSPRGCIRDAENDIAKILGAKKSFILTDGSTSGVLSIFYAATLLNAKKFVVIEPCHKSVYNACEVLKISPLAFLSAEDFFKRTELLDLADGVFCTSPDYYGNVLDLEKFRRLCDERDKLLLIDGAHGGHLHFEKALYAGAYADMWVDGVHKNLPAFTQGAVVSARTEKYAEVLRKAVDVFRTTSPSYPIMASVEYAVKYPRNFALETAVKAFAEKYSSYILPTKDWTKLCVFFGKKAFDVEKELERKGIYPEFCDGKIITFYLSPATKLRDFKKLCKTLEELFKRYPFIKKDENQIPAPTILSEMNENKGVERIDLSQAENRIAANDCGLFPPCTPLIRRGEKIAKDKIQLLQKAHNVFGLDNDKILVYKEE